MSPNILNIINNVLIKRHWLFLNHPSWGRCSLLSISCQENLLKYRSRCAQTGTRFPCTSVTTTSWHWNGETHYSTSERCSWSNYSWSSFSILFPFEQAVSTQRVSCTVSASHPPGLHVVTDNLLNTAAHHCLSVLCYVPPWASFSVIDVFVYMSLFTLHPFLLTYQQSFSRPIFSFSEAVYNCWFFPDSTQLLTGSPWYDLLALLPVNTLIDNEMCVTRIHDSQR